MTLMDAETLKIVLGALTPIGVLVVVVAWALISRRNGNGQTDRYQVVVAKLDASGTIAARSKPMCGNSAPV